MAEAVAAVGVASNILQIVDFGARVVKTAYKLASSASDALREDIDLEKLTQEQAAVVGRLHGALAASPALEEDERALVSMSGEFEKESTRLLNLLGDLKVATGSRGIKRAALSTTVALKIQRKRETIEVHRKNLQLINGQMATTLLSNSRLQIEKKASEMARIMASTETEVKATVRGVQEAIERRDNQHEESSWKTNIIESLSFPDMQLRHNTIPEAFPETYSWALEKDTAGLKTWLRTDSNIYWVSGKAGSGKSTLMKFLGNNRRTFQYLGEWSGGQDHLLVIQCYFWYAGSHLQKSIEGLLRTILYQILSSKSDVIPVLLPARWAKAQEAAKDKKIKQDPWSHAELHDAIQKVPQIIPAMNKTAALIPAQKFCVFIDGLDEYSGNHGELIRTLEGFTSSGNTKLCVSSRPWHVFTRAFEAQKPHLRLQDLTEEDIKLYIGSSLRLAVSTSPSLEIFEASEADVDSLTLDIAGRAEGVFLWVFLVVQSVLRGLDEGNDIPTLQRRVLELPTDLEPFFETMLSRVDKVHRYHTAQALYLAYLYVEDDDAAKRSSFLDFELLRRSPSGLMNTQYLWDLEPQILSADGLLALAMGTRTFLSACCKDLLVLPIDRRSLLSAKDNPSVMKVQFLHRTVYDYLRTTERIQAFLPNVPPSMKDGSGLHLLNMAKLKFYSSSAPPHDSDYFIRQSVFSLDRYWPGLSLEFTEQMHRSQKLHQEILCASIVAAYVAFEQHEIVRAFFSACDSKGRPLRMVWYLNRQFWNLYSDSTYPNVMRSPFEDHDQGHWPYPPLLAAVLGISPCRGFPPTAVNVDFLTYMLAKRTPPPTQFYTILESDIIVQFFTSALPPFLDVSDGCLTINWSSSREQDAEPDNNHERHIHRILQAIKNHGPTWWSEAVTALYCRGDKGKSSGYIYGRLLERLRPSSRQAWPATSGKEALAIRERHFGHGP